MTADTPQYFENAYFDPDAAFDEAYTHSTCQSSDGPVRFYYDHFPTHGRGLHDHVFVSCPHHGLDPLPNDGRWSITSVHPLTVTPSIHWADCGCHGFITNGKWQPL